MNVSQVALALLSSLLATSAACKEGTNDGTGPGTATKPAAKVNADGLAVEMSFVTGEHSKDSNAQSYSVIVEGDSVRYAGPHPPCQRGRCAHGEVELALDKAVYDEAVAAISKGDLTSPFSEKKEIGGLGNYLRVSATVTLAGKTGATEVVGMSQARDGSEVLTDEARARAEAVRMLLLPFQHAGEERLPK